MWMSQKTEYALRAMLELARREMQPGYVRSADVASSQNIPSKFLEMILVELRNARLVESQRGAVGGHRLARHASKICIGDILRAVDNPLNENIHNAPKEQVNDPFGFIWREIDRSIAEIVDGITLEEIKYRSAESAPKPDFAI
jgi:Rrf2 family iron-sulfur cluster assembly transcriptional regulator